MWQLAAIPFFAYAAWQDLRDRAVSSWIWSPLAVAGLYPIWLHPTRASISIAMTVVVVGSLYFVGKFGLADVKAAVVLAMLFPVYPDVVFSPEYGVFSLSVLLIAGLLAIVAWLLTDMRRDDVPFVTFMFVGMLICLSIGDPATVAAETVVRMSVSLV